MGSFSVGEWGRERRKFEAGLCSLTGTAGSRFAIAGESVWVASGGNWVRERWAWGAKSEAGGFSG